MARTDAEIVAAAQDVFSGRSSVVHGKGMLASGRPRFALFHSPISMCSEKVRVILEEAGFAYMSHPVDFKSSKPLHQHPDYVKLRLLAWRDMGRPALAGEEGYNFTGSSDVATNGLDPCVVPTLVDFNALGKSTPKVVVDSDAICRYLVAAQTESESLMPKEHLPLIEKHLRIVDETPHPALLYDGNIDHDGRPYYLKQIIKPMHHIHIKQMKDRLSERGVTWDDDDIERAYKAKLLKSEAGLEKSNALAKNDTSYIRAAVDKTISGLTELERDLEKSGGDWICGDRLTAADLVQGINLHRLTFLSNQYMWDDLPNVAAFAKRIFAQASMQNAVIFYPGMMPSRGTAPIYSRHRGTLAGFLRRRHVDAMNTMLFCVSNPGLVVGSMVIVLSVLAAGQRRKS